MADKHRPRRGSMGFSPRKGNHKEPSPHGPKSQPIPFASRFCWLESRNDSRPRSEHESHINKRRPRGQKGS